MSNCDICNVLLDYEPTGPGNWVCGDCWLDLEIEAMVEEADTDRVVQ